MSKSIAMKFFTTSFAFLLIIFSCIDAISQQVKDYVLANTHAVSTNSMDSPNMDDLEAFGNAIGKADVVLLGEQDHGDAPAFMAKARLVKYLHEKKGFSVIAFESDFYGLTSAYDAMLAGNGDISRVTSGNIFTIWTKCQEAADIFRYIENTAKTSSPLIVTGFDSQLHGAYRRKHYANDLKSLLEDAGIGWNADLEIVTRNVQLFYPLHSVKSLGDTLPMIGRIVDSLATATASLPDSSYAGMLVKSLKAYIDQQNYYLEKSYAYMTVRDRQMAANLLWIRKYKYPGQKIIVWAHNYHVAKNTSTAVLAKYGRHHAMGEDLYRALGDSMYILGFTSYKGMAGRIGYKNFKVDAPKKESIEEWIKRSGQPFAFVDFKKFRTLYPGSKEIFFMKGKKHENAEASWTEVFDGVFYVEKMYACERVDD